MAKAERLYPPPRAPYDMLYVGSDRFPGTKTHPPVQHKPDTRKDAYQAALVFAAAKTMARNYGGTVKVALLGDAVLAVDSGFSLVEPEPHHDNRPQLGKLIDDLVSLHVEIWY